MADYVAKERLYHTADRKRIVKEGDPAAAFLVVGEGTILPEVEAKRLGLDAHMEHYTPQSALDREREALEAAVDRGAHYEAQVRRGVIDRLEHGEAPITRPATDVSGIGVVPTAAVPTPKPERRPAAVAARSADTAATAAEAKK